MTRRGHQRFPRFGTTTAEETRSVSLPTAGEEFPVRNRSGNTQHPGQRVAAWNGWPKHSGTGCRPAGARQSAWHSRSLQCYTLVGKLPYKAVRNLVNTIDRPPCFKAVAPFGDCTPDCMARF